MSIKELETGFHLARHVLLTSAEDACEQGLINLTTRYKYKGRDEYKQKKSKSIFASMLGYAGSRFFGLFDGHGEFVGWFNIKNSYITPYIVVFGLVIEDEFKNLGIGTATASYLRDHWTKFKPVDGTIGIMASAQGKRKRWNNMLKKLGYHPISLTNGADGETYINYVAGEVEKIKKRMKEDENCWNIHELLDDPRLMDFPSGIA